MRTFITTSKILFEELMLQICHLARLSVRYMILFLQVINLQEKLAIQYQWLMIHTLHGLSLALKQICL